MKGYRLTRKGWVVLFTLAFVVMLVLSMAVSAIIGNINNIVKKVEINEKQEEQKKQPPKVTPEITKENVEVVIYFSEGSTEIQKENLPVLDMIVKASKGIDTYKYALVAYSLGSGDKIPEAKLDRQEKLTVAREKAIRDYLVAKGIPDEKIGIRETEKTGTIDTEGSIDKNKDMRKIEIHLFVEKKN